MFSQAKRSRRRRPGNSSWSAACAEILETRQLLSASGGPDLLPLNADVQEAAAWMLGSVTVTVVGFESDGTLDPNLTDWTPEDIRLAKESVSDALQWWTETLETFNSVHELSFVVDYTHLDTPVQTRYETAWRAYNGNVYYHDMMLEFLEAANADIATDNSGLPMVTQSLQQFNHSQRTEYETNWALTIFITQGFRNLGNFPGSRWVGANAQYQTASINMMGYANQSQSPPEFQNYNHVVAHEMGHVFHARDEYLSFEGAYTLRSGVYNTQNLNAVGGNPAPDSRVESIMDGGPDAYANHAISTSAAAMIGWQDSDGDGIFDVLDQSLNLTGEGRLTSLNTYSFDGASDVNVFDQQNPEREYTNDLTINTVDIMEYRLNGGDWVQANTYRDYQTPVAFETPTLSPGNYVIDVRTRSRFSPIDAVSGVASNTFSESFSVPEPPPANRVPEIVGPPAQWVVAGDTLSVPVTISDADGDVVALSAEVLVDGTMAELAWQLDRDRNLRPRSADYGSGWILNAKLFWSNYGVDYITSDGSLYNYVQGGSDKLIAELSPFYYDHPEKLDNAERPTPASVADARVEGHTVFITPVEDFQGSFRVLLTASDSFDSSEAELLVTVEEPAHNMPPSLGELGTLTFSSGQTVGSVQLDLEDDRTSLPDLQITATSSNVRLFPAGSISISIANGIVTALMTPRPGKSGTANVTITVTDGDGARTSKTLHVRVPTSLQNGVLSISGNRLGNRIDVSGGQTVVVNVDGTLFQFPRSSIREMIVNTGPGNDQIRNQTDIPMTGNGGSGNDIICGGYAADTLNGGNGIDQLFGGEGMDWLNGGPDDDVLHGGTDSDTLLGGNGNDTLYGDDGDDKLYGGNGHDRMYGNSGADLMEGMSGDDVLEGGLGNDKLNGNAGNDVIRGRDGSDIIQGGPGNDQLYGHQGADRLYGGLGNDYVEGGSGNDLLKGHAGNDVLRGDTGDDSVFGGDGDDKLVGGQGFDYLNGGIGNDLLDGHPDEWWLNKLKNFREWIRQ